MQTRTLRWYERCQLQLSLNFQLVPSKDMSLKEWAFSPYFGITKPKQQITTRFQLPEGTSYSVDTLSVGEGPDKKFYSNVFWIRGAVRVLGLDVGAGFFWRVKQSVKV
jgi:hypothetical protein